MAGFSSKALECPGSEPYSQASLLFSNGTLASKSQFGLAASGGGTEVKGSMTLANFNELKLGQTSAEVEAITGPCEKTSETNIGGQESFTLTCYGADGLSNAFLLISNDTLDSKNQFGLT